MVRVPHAQHKPAVPFINRLISIKSGQKLGNLAVSQAENYQSTIKTFPFVLKTLIPWAGSAHTQGIAEPLAPAQWPTQLCSHPMWSLLSFLPSDPVGEAQEGMQS